jgi:hypothetical protein
MKLEFSFFFKCLYINFYKNPFSGSRVVPCGQTDGNDFFRNIADAPKSVTLCRLVKFQTFRSTAVPWRRRYAFTNTHGVTFHRTYQHQHRPETFKSHFITAVRMMWRNTGCDRHVQCTGRVTASFAVWCSLHNLLSQFATVQTRGDCFADAPTSLSRDPQLVDNYINVGEDVISYVSTFWPPQGIKVRHVTGEGYK